MPTPLRLVVTVVALLLVGAGPPRALEMPPNLRPVGLPWIDYRTPDTFLLPTPPRAVRAPVYLGQDLACVPEVALETPNAWKLEPLGEQKHFDHLVAGARHLDSKYEDGYLKILARSRADLAGLPFVTGRVCRMTEQETRAFRVAAALVNRDSFSARQCLALLEEARDHRESFRPFRLWDDVHLLTADALVAAAQAHGPASPRRRVELVRVLEAIPSPSSTRELARAAVFSFDVGVREVALKPLGARPRREATAVLAAGIRHPWPTVASNAIDAAVKLRRTDMMPLLLALLDGPDPRAPRAQGGTFVARELVRINSHRNCLLCHAPGKAGVKDSDAALLASIPHPSAKLSPRPTHDRDYLLVRIDVTYLRQDFSVMQKVEDAAPWPTMQRFDFVVRNRTLTDAEAADLRERLKPPPGKLSPYQEAAVNALRKLTGRDFGADAAAWRRHLKLPPA